MEIPLFPLRTVLFPGMTLPLRIFEERYQVMTRELLQTGGHFGVLLIRSGNEIGGGAVPHEVGTTATIEQAEELGGGRFAIAARGVQRFRLIRMLPARPYPYGEVELIDDSRWADHSNLQRALETVRATFPVYFRLALSLTDQWARGLKLPQTPHALVDFLGPWLQAADEEAKQKLLEPQPAVERVAQLADLLDDLVNRTREQAVEHQLRKYRALGSGN